jgi:hypothetical protein
MQSIQRHWKIALLLVIGLLLMAGAWVFLVQKSVFSAGTIAPKLLAQFSQNDVGVRIEVAKNAAGRLVLLGTFTPTRPHYHLYSKDLPPNGLNGLGRPTRMEVFSSSGINWMGALTSNQPVDKLYFKTLDLYFPVYPDGPVTLSLPFAWAAGNTPPALEVSLTYMACSDTTCLPPVVDKRLTLKFPPEILP